MHLSHRKFYRKTGENKSFLFALLVMGATLLFSCSTNFNVNAPYKQENAVYGLLEIHNNAQVIKIGKVFQNGTGLSASQAARQFDSLYQADSLEVTLSDNNSGQLTRLRKFYNTAVTYDVNIYIPVKEYSTKDSNLIRTDTLVYNVLKTYQVSTAGLNVIQDIQGVQFYEFIGASLKVDGTVYRKMDSLDFEITGAGQDLANYIQVNTPSQGIVQKKPDYTNISNGVGIFSSRCITHIKAPLTLASYQLLNTSSYTQGLNFIK
jgi:hypothetical protein